MWKSKLIFRFILWAAIATSVQLTSTTDYAAAKSTYSNQTVESEQQNDTSEITNIAITGIAIGVIAGLLISSFWYQKRRHRRLYSSAKIDRFQEEFLCEPLTDYYFSNSSTNTSLSNYQKKSTTATPEEIPVCPTSEESLLTSDRSNLVTESNSLSGRYQKLIEEIVATALKDEIRSQEYIYRQLANNISGGTGEIFERCLCDRLNFTRLQLDKVRIYSNLFQRETPELKKARLSRTLKALQTIQSEWERIQKQKRNRAAVSAAVQQILTASQASRLSVLLQIIDPNQNQGFSQNQLQQLAQELKQAVFADEDFQRKQEIQQLAIAIANGVESYQKLEGYLVSWIYEPKPTASELTQFPPKQEPWVSWSQKVSSPLTQMLFCVLADGISATELVVRQPYLNTEDLVELIVIVQRIQKGLVTWFERQPLDSKWGTSASIATFLTFAVVWCELSNGFHIASNIYGTKGEELAKACFQIVLQILRTFAHREYFPLYGGVFAFFGRDALRDAMDYLNTPLKEVEATQEKARILTLLGYSHFTLGKYPEAKSFHQQALEIARQTGDRACEIANLNHSSRVCAAQKDYSQAINYSQRALILARQIGDACGGQSQRFGEAHALANLGYGEVFAAQQIECIEPEVYEQAIEYLRRSLELSEKLSDSPFGIDSTVRQIQALCYISLGIAHFAVEKPQTAIEQLEKGAQTVQLCGDRYLQGLNFLYLAESHYKLNHLETAVYNSWLGMYILEEIIAVEWRQAAGLLTILQSKLGHEVVEQVLVNSQKNMIKFIGVDGYDYLPELLEEYKRSHY
ncbi:MAG: tetratricopeptide repeat protein [Nostoc sp. ChiSLP02]|nr:tetratricopeptide repeat protein [Nostoc sp. DedSLP05]MDZ8097850.1 tetratricopeptide repeat protein [Nostoc sp. DedSLP01]MDZ8183935.1 tetratricopeptide repeat protein [Nostoc sp. ChiSLP02]